MRKPSFPLANFLWNGVMATCTTIVIYKYGFGDPALLMLLVWFFTNDFYN